MDQKPVCRDKLKITQRADKAVDKMDCLLPIIIKIILIQHAS